MTTTPCPTRPLDLTRSSGLGRPSASAPPPVPDQRVLHDVADAAAGAEGHLGVEVLAGAVARLEALAGASLGSVDGEPLVVLQRRAGRVLRLLAGRAAGPGSADLAALAADLRDPAAALLRASAGASAGGSR